MRNQRQSRGKYVAYLFLRSQTPNGHSFRLFYNFPRDHGLATLKDLERVL